MIMLTRLNGEHIVVNAGMIEFLEATPDTVVSLATGRKWMVRESIPDVIALAIAFFQQIGYGYCLSAHQAADAENGDDATA